MHSQIVPDGRVSRPGALLPVLLAAAALPGPTTAAKAQAVPPARAGTVTTGAVAEAPARSAARADPLAGLDAEALRILEAWGVPGMSVAVVKGDSAVVVRGYGLRDVRSRSPVDGRTLFAIGSLTKAFTSAAAAVLVEDGRVTWDDRIRDHLPWFRLHDRYASDAFTLRDAMSHRSGLGRRGDLLWYGSGLDREEILRRVRHLEPVDGFRAAYGYQNTMFLAAGEATAAAAGTTWDRLVQDRLLDPLGMEDTNTTVRALAGRENVAAPHEEVDDVIRAVPYRDLDNAAPAGSVNSSARDMARWIRFQLAGGSLDGRRLLERATLTETWEPHTVIPVDGSSRELYPELDFQSYALGWVVSDRRNRHHLWHTGGIDGMSAYVGLFPEDSLGVAVLTNRGGSSAHRALAEWIYDAYLGGPERDWSAELLDRRREAEREAEEARREREEARRADTEPALPEAAYAGRYEHEMYGALRVVAEPGGLVLRRGEAFVGDLGHWQHETFRVDWRGTGPGELFATFRLDRRGRVQAVELEGMGRFDRAERVEPDPGAAR